MIFVMALIAEIARSARVTESVTTANNSLCQQRQLVGVDRQLTDDWNQQKSRHRFFVCDPLSSKIRITAESLENHTDTPIGRICIVTGESL